MSGISSNYKSVIIGGMLSMAIPFTAHAGRWADKCEKAGNKSKGDCQTAVNEAKAKEAGRSAPPSANSQNIDAKRLKSDIAAQKGDLADAQKKCEDAKKECNDKCENEKGEQGAGKHTKDPKDPLYGEATGDKNGQIDGKKQSACVAPIMAMIGQLASGQSPLGGQGNEAGNTAQNASGMPIPIPIPPKDEKKDEKKTDDPLGTTNQPLDCNQSQNSKYSDCNDTFINKCSGNMGQDGCDQFINRYCGSMNGSNSTTTPAPTDTSNTISNFSVKSVNTATANLVVDKQGEGMGSAFCGKANGYRFCQASGRSQCPSCQNISSWSSSLSTEQLQTAQNSCPTDPMFSDPAIAAQLSSAPAAPTTPADPVTGGVKDMSIKEASLAAASAAAGGGSGAMSGGRPSSNEVSQGGIAEGSNGGVGSLDMNSGSGGGSGSSAGDESGSHPGDGTGTQSASGLRTPAGALVSNAADVANQYGPNIFSISTTTYRALCTRGRLLHCRER